MVGIFVNGVDKVELWQLRQRQSLPLQVKIIMSLLRIQKWYEAWDGDVYVSFSGGKDSTVLLHLVRTLYPRVKAVFIDTGLEYPEIRAFVKTIDNVVWIKPDMHYTDVINKHGYPVVSKEVSETIDQVRKGYKSRFKKLDTNYTGRYSCLKWKFLLDAPFKISNLCCNEMKKKPVKKYEKLHKVKPFVGTMADESSLRTQSWLKSGCNAFDNSRPISSPLSFWKESDIWEYLKTYNVPYSKIYDMGETRTGCMFCMFGCHLEEYPNRFQRMASTHPKQFDYCINKLGIGKVLDYINVPYMPNEVRDGENIQICMM